MRITINIPTDQAERVLAAVQSIIASTEPAKNADLKALIAEYIKSMVRGVELRAAARLAAQTATDDVDIT